MAANDTILSSLRQAWDAQPDVPFIPNYGEDSVVWGKKIEMSQYSTYNSLDILEALQSLITSKDTLVLIPSFGGTMVSIPQMAKESLKISATQNSKMESSPIIDGEFVDAFNVLSIRMDHEDPAAALEAREMAEDMVFERTLVKISAGSVKFFVFYFDESVNSLVFLIGNRKVVSFDQTKIRTILNRLKKAQILAEKQDEKINQVSQRRKKRVISSSSSEEEEESESSSGSSSESEDNDGRTTPVFNPDMLAAKVMFPEDNLLKSYSTLPVVQDFAQSQAFNQAKAEADSLLIQAQERVATLAAQALVYQTSNARVGVPSSPMAGVNGPALKTTGLPVKHVSLPGYMIPKKSVPVGVAYSSKSSSKKHRSKKSKRSDRKAASKSAGKKIKHQKKSRKAAKAKKYVQSSASSASSMSESEVSENEEQKQV